MVRTFQFSNRDTVFLRFVLHVREALQCLHYTCVRAQVRSACRAVTGVRVFRRMMWAAGTVAAMSSITFPAVSALVSRTADADQQGRFCPNAVSFGQGTPCTQTQPGVVSALVSQPESWHGAAHTPEPRSQHIARQVPWKVQQVCVVCLWHREAKNSAN